MHPSIKKVIFVGSNPSNSSPDLSAFNTNTGSGRTLREWIEKAEISEAVSINVSDEKTINNRSLRKSEIDALSQDLEGKIRHHMTEGTKIVALGKTAAFALKCTRLTYLELSHPSGLNRKLNDPDFVEKEIRRLKDYVGGN